MVASVDEYASRAGVEVLKRGGNAVDAAVAVHMVLAVTHPQAGNLGGGGFMIVHMEGTHRTTGYGRAAPMGGDGRRTVEGSADTGAAIGDANGRPRDDALSRADGRGTGGGHDVDIALDFREKAPLGAHRDMYLTDAGEVIQDASTMGYLACGVPGSVAGMWAIHRMYGTLPWEDLLEPAYRLARDGFVVGPLLARDLREAHENLTRFPGTAAIFTRGAGGEGSAGPLPLNEGDTLIQEDLAWTIKQVMERGMDGFYRGEVAARIAADMRAHGGLITERDLALYRPVEREPIRCEFAGHTVVSMPPPSSGGVLLCQMLGMLSGFDMKAPGLNSAGYIHLLTEVEKPAYADRALYLGDSDFYPVPVDHLLSPEYVALRAGGVNLERATPSRDVGAGPGPPGHTETLIDEIHSPPPLMETAPDTGESLETTHFSIVDRHGNAVSCTTTLNGRFGSCVVAAGTGVLLNNEMDDFSVKPGVPNLYGLVGGEANAIEPGKRMLSSMTPTIVLGHDRVDGPGGGSAAGGHGPEGGSGAGGDADRGAVADGPGGSQSSSGTVGDGLDGSPSAGDSGGDGPGGAQPASNARVKLVLGSPGGSTIITTVLQVILNVLIHGLPLEQAVAAPRFHHQWLPDETRVEAAGFPREVLETLQAMGHNIREVDFLGDVHAVMVEWPAVEAGEDKCPGAQETPGIPGDSGAPGDSGIPGAPKSTSASVAPGDSGAPRDSEAPGAQGRDHPAPQDLADRGTPALLVGVSDPRRGGAAIGY